MKRSVLVVALVVALVVMTASAAVAGRWRNGPDPAGRWRNGPEFVGRSS